MTEMLQALSPRALKRAIKDGASRFHPSPDQSEYTEEDAEKSRTRYEEMMGWDRPLDERADIAEKLAIGAPVRHIPPRLE